MIIYFIVIINFYLRIDKTGNEKFFFYTADIHWLNFGGS